MSRCCCNRATGVPIWVGKSGQCRACLVRRASQCDVIVCDDLFACNIIVCIAIWKSLWWMVAVRAAVGVYRLPLRESPARLNTVSALVYHQRRSALEQDGRDGSEPGRAPRRSVICRGCLGHSLRRSLVCSGLNRAYALTEVQRTIALNDLVQQYGVHTNKSSDAGGIAQPSGVFRHVGGFGF